MRSILILLVFYCSCSEQTQATDNAVVRSPGWMRSIPAVLRQRRKNSPAIQHASTTTLDYFYGITPQTATLPRTPSKKRKRRRGIRNVRESLATALDELERLREEIQDLRRLLKNPQADDEDRRQRKRRKELASVASNVEAWAEAMLVEDDDEQWSPVECTKMLRGRYNAEGQTRAYVTWMKDSRQSQDGEDEDSTTWPCIRIFSTIDAPVDEVSLYLSQAEHSTHYNSLLTKHRDLEIVSPQSKICWAQTPQILFVKPRDFITYCSYRWRKDGSQLVVNQALNEYEDLTATAFAFRGATLVSPSPDDPDKTDVAMIAHASPGRDTPAWACRTAINTLAAIEPFKLFYKMNQGIQEQRATLQATLQERFMGETAMVNSGDGIPTQKRPAGIAQMGYACFWPDGADTTTTQTDEEDNEME